MKPAASFEFLALSDVHLGAWPSSTAQLYIDALVGFLDDVAARPLGDGHERHLLLLGDFFDVIAAARQADGDGAASRAALEQLLDAHAPVVDALARVIDSGAIIDIVIGNHDIELAWPGARDRFRQRVGREHAAEALRFHPWFLYLPGILYAEHGHQHHDINSVPTPLAPYRPGREGQLDLPPAALLRGRGPAGVARAVARMASRAGPPTRGRRQVYQREVLAAHAGELGLDHACLVALDSLATVSLRRTAARLARQAARRPRRAGLPPTGAGGYLHRAGFGIERVMEAMGVGVPFYLFGHTHVPERLPLAGSSEYLNCGTWSPAVPAELTAAVGAPLLTFVQVTARPGSSTPIAELLRWDPVAGAARPYASPASPSALDLSAAKGGYPGR